MVIKIIKVIDLLLRLGDLIFLKNFIVSNEQKSKMIWGPSDLIQRQSCKNENNRSQKNGLHDLNVERLVLDRADLSSIYEILHRHLEYRKLIKVVWIIRPEFSGNHRIFEFWNNKYLILNNKYLYCEIHWIYQSFKNQNCYRFL